MVGHVWLLALLAPYVIVAGTFFMPQKQEKLLRVLSEVASGPARGQVVILHLDAALPADLFEAAVRSLRPTLHSTLTFGNDHSWPANETLTLLQNKRPLHIFVWFTSLQEVLRPFCYYWRPFSLLLVSLRPASARNLLREEVLHAVQNVAALEPLPVADNTSNLIGVFAQFPFSLWPVKFLGHWKSDTFSTWKSLFPDRFPTFEGYTFHIASWFTDPPYLYGDMEDRFKVRGVSIRILDSLSSKMNFTYTLTPQPPDFKWGVIENGSWVGVLGMIARGEKNFTINSFSLTDDRTKVFDASTCIQIDPYSAFLPSPQQLPKWLSIFRPFTTTVLASLVLTTAMCSILLLLKERLMKRMGVPQPSQGSATSFWLVLQGSLVGQSVPGLPKALWQRTFVAVWLISCLVVTAAYASNLVGILTSPAYYRRLHTIQELVESDYRLALVDNGSYIAAHVKNNNESSLQSFQQRMDVFPTYKEAMAALEKGSHFIFQIRGYLSLELHKYLEDEYWYMMQQNIASGQQVWYFPKHTPWKHKFDEVISQLSWFGFLEHWREVEEEAWKKTVKPTRKGGKREDSSPAQSLTLSHLQGSFYILSFAWALSVLVFFLEISSHRYRV